MADPYRSQLDLNPAPQPGASAADFGASIGQGLIEGQAHIDNAIHTLKERDRDEQAAQAGVDFANASLKLDEASQSLRDSAQPGAAGHVDAVTSQFNTVRDEELGKIRDPHLRAAFSARYAELGANVVGRENGWASSKRVDKLTTDFEDMGDTLGTGQASNPDAVGLQVSLGTIETVGHHLAVGADLQDKLIKEQQRKVAVAWGNAMQNKNPQLLVAALDHGVLSPYLEGSDVNTLRDGGLVEIRRQEAEARRKQNEAEAAARETVSLGLKKVRDGYIPSTEEWSTWGALTKTYNLQGPEWDLGVAKQTVDINRETRTWTPTQWHGAINELEGKGDKRTEGENVTMKLLESAAPGAIGRFNSDPYAAAAAGGNPAPAVDWTNPDPKAIENRVTWARAFAGSAGLDNVPYLSNDELKPLRDRVAQGPAGQLEIAGQLRQTFGAAIASDLVRQIDPSNNDLKIMVGLHPRVSQLYREGVEALKDGRVKLGLDATDTDAMTTAFAPYKDAIPTEMQSAVFNAARNITAGISAEFNRAQPTGDELTGAYRQAIQRAGGMLGSPSEGSARGGFINWNGRYAWMPPTMSRDDFQRRISRAGEKEWEHAGGGAPYYLGSDGKLAKMNESQISHLGQYRLETVNPGLYQLLGPDGGHVVTDKGQPWQFDIRNLGAK